MEKDIKVLEEMCKPIVDYIKNNYNSHFAVVITDSQIKLVRDEIELHLKEVAPEVPVPEQVRIFIPEDSEGKHCTDGVSYSFK